MKKHKGQIQMGIVIGIFSVIIVACLISIFSRLYADGCQDSAGVYAESAGREESIGIATWAEVAPGDSF